MPPGFAHGMLLVEDTLVEYLCSGEYNPKCEAGISPFSHDLDWSLCDPGLRAIFDAGGGDDGARQPQGPRCACLGLGRRLPLGPLHLRPGLSGQRAPSRSAEHQGRLTDATG